MLHVNYTSPLYLCVNLDVRRIFMCKQVHYIHRTLVQRTVTVCQEDPAFIQDMCKDPKMKAGTVNRAGCHSDVLGSVCFESGRRWD